MLWFYAVALNLITLWLLGNITLNYLNLELGKTQVGTSKFFFANCSVSAKSEVLNGWLPFMIESSDRIPFSDRINGKYHAPMLFNTAARTWL